MILHYVDYRDKETDEWIREWFPNHGKADSRKKHLRACCRDRVELVTEPRKVDVPTGNKPLLVQWLNGYAACGVS
jgi:hypothetical protein